MVASFRGRMASLAKCFFGNTRLQTASATVQTASLSLPVGTCELVWACDGGGHSRGRPFRSFRCLGDNEGNGKSGWCGELRGPSRVSSARGDQSLPRQHMQLEMKTVK